MGSARAVRVIPVIKREQDLAQQEPIHRKKVAAYARVSTDNEEQLSSYEAQVDYYTRHIQEKPEWDFVEVYTDEGISATSTKKRAGFNRMIEDALTGKIDLIVTKSVSRFARNTVDTLTTVRKLKDRGVEVFFEKENIYTMDSKGELLITIMSSLAQEESRSISENVTWGHRKRFADGKVLIPYGQFLGYEKGPDGLPSIIEKEAQTVRLIYNQFLSGKTTDWIAKHLTDKGILTPGGKRNWQKSTVQSILTNEKYKGDALLQKSFTVDFLTKKSKVNEGEVPQYYVENSHPAIIRPEVFDMVQREVEKRKTVKGYKTGSNSLSGMLVCSECGSFFGSKVWHSTSKYRRVIWQCNRKFNNEKKCKTPHLKEETVKEAFIMVFNELQGNRDGWMPGFEEATSKLTDTKDLEKKLKQIREEETVVTELLRKCVEENARTAQDQEAYLEKYEGLVNRYEGIKKKIDDAEAAKGELYTKARYMKAFLQTLKEREEILDGFDEDLWSALVDKVAVKENGELTFIFKNGLEMPWKPRHRKRRRESVG